MKITARINDWHRPRNAACAQNENPDADCTCKRQRQRKPYRTIRVIDPRVPHAVRPRLITEVHPNGTMMIRESGRRRASAYAVSIGEIYGRLLMAEAIAKMNAKRKRKGGRK